MSQVKQTMDIPLNCTLDDFLGGKVKLLQPKDGYRVSMDTVLLAASVPAQKGDMVLEAGTGTGGAALCLASRVEGVSVVGVELQRNHVEIACENISLNSMSDRVSVIEGDITNPPARLKEGSFDHVIVNPPYLSPGKAIRPPEKSKGLAHMNESANLKDWLLFCVRMAKHKGTITVVHRADRLDELISILHRRVGDLALLPLWPRAGEPAKRVIVQGRKGVHGVMRVLPGIALHGSEDRYTQQAESILRDGGNLDLGTIKPMKSG